VAASDGRPDALFVLRKVRNGRWDHWQLRVDDSAVAGQYPKLLIAGPTRLALWADSPANGGVPTELHLAVSSDTARSWHRLASWSSGSPIFGLDAVVDAHGHLTTSMTNGFGGRGHPRTLEWSGTETREIPPLLAEALGAPRLAPSPTCDLREILTSVPAVSSETTRSGGRMFETPSTYLGYPRP